MTPAAFRKLALSFPEAHEEPHFERTSFRFGKKIFATMVPDGSEAMIPVKPLSECFALLEGNPALFFDYGGWTMRYGSLGIRLPKANAKVLKPLLQAAYERAAKGRKRRGTG